MWRESTRDASETDVDFGQTLSRLDDLSTTSGPIKLVAENGTITVNEGSQAGTSGRGIMADNGDILLEARSANSDVILQTDIRSTDGHITVIADRDISSADDISTTGSGTIYLKTNTGSITLNDADANSTGVTTIAGDILIDAAANVTINAVVNTTGSGDIGIRAGNNLSQNANIVSDSGNVLLTVGNTFTMAGGTAITATGDAILIDAVNGIQLGLLDAANVAINTQFGDITDNNGEAVTNVRAVNLILSAANGIIGGPDSSGVPNGPNVNDAAIDLEVTTVAARSANGIYLQEVAAGRDIVIDQVATVSVTVNVEQATFDSGLARRNPDSAERSIRSKTSQPERTVPSK